MTVLHTSHYFFCTRCTRASTCLPQYDWQVYPRSPPPHYCHPFTRLLTPLRARRASARSNRQPGRHLYFGRLRIIRPLLVSTGGRAHGAGLTFTEACSLLRHSNFKLCFVSNTTFPLAHVSRSWVRHVTPATLSLSAEILGQIIGDIWSKFS